jgi:hypothetical protein
MALSKRRRFFVLTALMLGSACVPRAAHAVIVVDYGITALPYFQTGETTLGADNTFQPNLSGPIQVGPDRVYEFNVVTAGSMTFTVSPLLMSFDAGIYLLNATTTSLIAGADSVEIGAETFTVPSVPVGSYYFAVDSSIPAPLSGSSGTYALNVTGTAQLSAVPEVSAALMGTVAAAVGIAGNWLRRRFR